MSTTSPSATLTDGSTSTSTSTSSSSSQADTATLYLFTFLATILILVLLSASLVLRSYILRRRYRQHFQLAFADGLFADLDRPPPRSARRLGPKPVVWDTWIHPADKDPSWSSITPVAVRCSPLPSLPSTALSSPRRSIPPPVSPSSRLAFFSPLRIPSPLSLSSRPSLLLPAQAQSRIGPPIPSSTRSAPPAGLTSPDPSTRTEQDAAALSVCMLVAMPDPAAPVHRPAAGAKGKGMHSPAHLHSGDALPLSPSSRRRSGPRTAVGGDRPPLLEFGVAQATTDEWVWRT